MGKYLDLFYQAGSNKNREKSTENINALKKKYNQLLSKEKALKTELQIIGYPAMRQSSKVYEWHNIYSQLIIIMNSIEKKQGCKSSLDEWNFGFLGILDGNNE